MTKIDIISGFLGAGKTTLIKKLLEGPLRGQKVVLIENEFGEIGIDSGFLGEAGIEITEMNAGCICCSLVGDFAKALEQVLDTYAPARILIEPSGVGKLSDVIRAVQGVAERRALALSSFVTVVDTLKCKMYTKNFGEFFLDQIEHAGAIFLSRTSGIRAEKLDECVDLLRSFNRSARIVTTPWDELSGAQLLTTMEESQSLAQELLAQMDVHEGCGCGHDHHAHHEGCSCGHDDHAHHGGCGCGHDHHHAEDVFESWGVETPRVFTRAQLSACLAALGDSSLGTVLRAKGIVSAAEGGWLHFDYVPDTPEIRDGAADYTGRLCVIGTGLDQKRLAALFDL